MHPRPTPADWRPNPLWTQSLTGCWQRGSRARTLRPDTQLLESTIYPDTREGFDRHHVAATVPREAEAVPKLLSEPEVRENFSGPSQAETEIVPVAGHCVPARGEAVQVPEFAVPLTWTGNHAEIADSDEGGQ